MPVTIAASMTAKISAADIGLAQSTFVTPEKK